MGTFKEQVTIKAPRNQVFSYVEDLGNRERFMSESFGAFRLLSSQSKGQGAKIAFGFKLMQNAPSEAELVRVLWPKSIEESGKFGQDQFTTTYLIEETSNGYTQVTLEHEYPDPTGIRKFMPGSSIRPLVTIAYRKALQGLRATLNAHQH